MGKNLKYGEFTFSAPKERPSIKGYAHGGETKGQAKVSKVMGEFKSGDLHSGSSKGPIVKNPKQAIAIALSEKRAAGYKKGGEAWEGSKEDVRQDKILAKKHKMSYSDWEKTKMDEKHDKQQSMKGLKKGGEAKSNVKTAKLVGMKMEPEGIVKKEVALLKKSGAPTKMIKHEESEGALMGLKKGGRACYAEGGMTDKELAAMEDARADKALRDQDRGYREHYAREKAENEADRKAVKDALLYVPRKVVQGAKAAYGAVTESDFAKGARNYGRLYKEGLGMKPDTPYEKKKGGSVKKGVPVHNRTPKY